MWRRSFQARLVAGALVWIAAGLLASTLVLSEIFKRHIEEQFDSELSDHSSELERLLVRGADGAPVLTHELSDGRFIPAGSGFYWQVEAANGARLLSESLAGQDLALRRLAVAGLGGGRQFLVDGPSGKLVLLLRELPASGVGQNVLLAVGMDRLYLDRIEAEFQRTLIMVLALMALGHTIAAYLQIRVGLRPLDRISAAIAAIRAGRSDRLPDDLPTEIAPLVGELNSLVAANTAIAQRGRVQAGNLAHALKNPLTVILDEAASLRARGDEAAAAALEQECGRMRRHVAYYLAQAQATAPHAGRGSATAVTPVLRAIVTALERQHRERDLAFTIDDGAPEAVAACGEEELHEIFGNLIDNAAKWARGRVAVTSAVTRDGRLSVRVDDDGPGMPPDAREIVFDVGRRLDERTPGSGLGLAIVRDIVERRGGKVWLDTSALGGAAAHVELPLAAPSPG